VKKSHLTKSILAALLLASPLAGAELREPSVFEPVPVFEDEGLANKRGGSGPPPAAHAPAKQEAAVQSDGPVRSTDLPTAAEAQSNPDPVRIAETGPLAPLPTPAIQTEPEITQAMTEKSFSVIQGLLIENYYIGLIILGIAGLVFWSSRHSGSKVHEHRLESLGISAGAAMDTGVARYIKSLDILAKPATVETGVTKYLKKLDISTR
jgi:hypothetical protein